MRRKSGDEAGKAVMQESRDETGKGDDTDVSR